MRKRLQGYYAAITRVPKIASAPLTDDRAKAYMHNKIITCSPVYNVDILAYFIGADKVSILFYDKEGNQEKLKALAACINGEFSEYYNQTFEKIGMVFRQGCPLWRLRSIKQVQECMVSFHRACLYEDKDIASYPFSSYIPYLSRHLHLVKAYFYTFGEHFDPEGFVQLHSRLIPKKDYTIPVLEKLTDVLAMETAPYGTAEVMNKTQLGNLVAEAALRAGASYYTIYKKLDLAIDNQVLLLHTMLHLTLKLRYPFFDAAEVLQVESFTEELIRDLIDQIVQHTGYSVQYTKYFLGL